MGTEVKNKLQAEPFVALVSPNNDRFNFDLWAKEVRIQLLAALAKRAMRSDN